jgi:HK97 family phage major capsid protein
VAASQIKVLLDDLAAILAEMGALDEGATDNLAPDGNEATVVVGEGDMPADPEAARQEPAEDDEDEDEDEPAAMPGGAEEDDEEEEPEMAKARSLERLLKRADKIKSRIAFYERKAAKEQELRSVLERAAPAPKDSPVRPAESRVYAVPKSHGNLRAFLGSDGPERAYRAGMHLRGFVFGDADARRWCYDHGVESRAQAGGINALGGILTSPELSTEIIRLVEQFGAFPAHARRVRMSSDTFMIARRTGGLAARPVGENAEVLASDVTFDNVELVARIWGVANRIPASLLEDSIIDLADTMAVEAAQAFAEAFDNAGFVGDGTNTYHNTVGVCTKILKPAHSASVVTATGHSTFDDLTMKDFTNLIARLPLYARTGRNAAWYISPAGWGSAMLRLAMLPGGSSAPGGNATDNIAAGFGERFLGYQVHLVHSMESNLTGTSGSVACLFGDLSQACAFGERRAIGMRTSTERYIEFDQVLTFATTRNAMVAHDVGSTTKAGPIVALKFG